MQIQSADPSCLASNQGILKEETGLFLNLC